MSSIISYKRQGLLTLREHMYSPPPPVFGVVRVAHFVSFFFFVFVVLVFILCIVYSMLPVSLDCPFLFTPYCFLYHLFKRCKLYVLELHIHWLPLEIYLSREDGCDPINRSNIYYSVVGLIVYLYFLFCLSVSCVPSVASFSGFFIRDCPFGFLQRLFHH